MGAFSIPCVIVLSVFYFPQNYITFHLFMTMASTSRRDRGNTWDMPLGGATISSNWVFHQGAAHPMIGVQDVAMVPAGMSP